MIVCFASAVRIGPPFHAFAAWGRNSMKFSSSLHVDGAAEQKPLLPCQLVAWIHVSHVVFYNSNSTFVMPTCCLDTSHMLFSTIHF